MNMVLMKTKYPLSVYVILMIMAVELYVFIYSPIVKMLFYFVLTFLLLYAFFSRYACKVILYEDKVLVKYFFFWDKDICIPLGKFVGVDYYKGFYDFVDDQMQGGFFNFPKYCYDKIVLKSSDEEVELFINTRLFSFKKLYHALKRTVEQGNARQLFVSD
jgi:hypothetical protein